MKKLFAGIMAMMLCVSAMPLRADAEGETVNVKVTISDKDGNAVLQQKPVTVTDIDGDGALTINDALFIAHEENYEGGAEAGYSSAIGQYGLYLEKLWGNANGGGYGYYVNHVASMGLTDVVNNDDYLDVFTYTDLVGWSDKYVFFDSCNAEVLPNIPLHLTLSYADWTLGNVPVEGAVITINGEKTNFVTDADGKVEITFPEIGEYVVSAVSDTMTLVKPVYPVSVKESLVAYGDVDVDGDTDIIDVLKLNQYLLSLTELTEEGLKNADVDNNTLVNDADAISILKSLVGLVSLPVEAE